MKLEKGDFCPLLQSKCKGLECMWIHRIAGVNPNTGEAVDQWDCSIPLMIVGLLENAAQIRSNGAATESMRNEIVERMDTARKNDLVREIARLTNG